jgi:hypothetical protein
MAAMGSEAEEFHDGSPWLKPFGSLVLFVLGPAYRRNQNLTT